MANMTGATKQCFKQALQGVFFEVKVITSRNKKADSQEGELKCQYQAGMTLQIGFFSLDHGFNRQPAGTQPKETAKPWQFTL